LQIFLIFAICEEEFVEPADEQWSFTVASHTAAEEYIPAAVSNAKRVYKYKRYT
jgi:hypothetical protein